MEEKLHGISEITDHEFLHDFMGNFGLPEEEDYGSLFGRTVIVSTKNEKGEEDFNIMVSVSDDKGRIKFEELRGITGKEKEENKEIYTTTGRKLFEDELEEVRKTKSLKEFETNSGNRYTITRDEEGNLGFNEIFRENEKITSAQHIDTYSYDYKEDLINNYEEFDINQSDVEKAKEIFNRSKEEMDKTKESTKEDKGREL